MRTEEEVRQMIEELRGIDDQYGRHTAMAVIAALENVLNGPRRTGLCGCLGPAGCCVCQMYRLASAESNQSKDQDRI